MKLKSQKGQMIVEMVLFLTITMFTSYLLLNKLFKSPNKTQNPVYLFISKPWKSIGGMMESGAWLTRQEALKQHPNYWKRMKTQEGITLP